MSFNFPNTPTIGQVFTPVPGAVYTWDGVAWKMSGGGVLTQTTIAERRNRILNGAFQISQENGNTAVNIGGGLYPADQWVGSATAPAVITGQRVQVVTPNGSQNRLRVTVTTADASLAATDTTIIWTPLEGVKVADFGYGTAGARQGVLRFGWKSPAGTYSIRIGNEADVRSYVAQFTISAGQANTDTVQTFVIPGDTTGTWRKDTGIGMYVYFVLACGSAYQGVAGWQAGNKYGRSTNTNGVATANAVFEIHDVGLYLDPDLTGTAPRYEMPDEAAELLACQRYWRWTPEIQGVCYSATGFRGIISFSPTMRIAPTLTPVAGTIHVYNVVNATVTSWGAFDNKPDSLDITANISGGAIQYTGGYTAGGGKLSARM